MDRTDGSVHGDLSTEIETSSEAMISMKFENKTSETGDRHFPQPVIQPVPEVTQHSFSAETEVSGTT